MGLERAEWREEDGWERVRGDERETNKGEARGDMDG